MTSLYHDIIYGPVHSRRLGLSLGVNLLPTESKLCSFDCIYCECGWNAEHPGARRFNAREDVRRLLGETLERARQAALALPDDDYFALLLRMAKRYALGKSGEAAFSARDQKRMPKDFPAKLDAAAKELGGSLTVSKEPRDIDGGFVLLYGGMEENCSLTALFDANREDFLDAARAALFGEG